MRRRRLLLPGPVLLGFADLFDAAYGRPCAASEIPLVTPTAIGGALLPFSCPHCGAVRPQMATAQGRAEHSDPQRGFYFCPACEGRYRLAPGAPPAAPIDLAGAVWDLILIGRSWG